MTTDDIAVPATTGLPANTAPAGLASLANLLADLRVAKDEADDAAKAANAAYEAAETALFDALENAGISQIRTERGLFRMNDLAWASVLDEAAAREWAEHNEPALLTLNRARLSVIVRKAISGEEPAPGLEAGQLPPGVDFRTSRKINWRRS